MNDEFDSFAREYCMYLGNTETNSDEYNDAFFEIIWDYRTYFEQINELGNQKGSNPTLVKKKNS